jgi:CIC family chloride channel protein
MIEAVMVSAIAAVLISNALSPTQPIFFIAHTSDLGVTQVTSLVLLGLITGGLAILIMYLVARIEALFARTRVPAYIRPAIGGLLVGLMAIVSPKVLSSGHAAVEQAFALGVLQVKSAALLLVLKALASAVSIGSGFRGGLFFASLLLGALTGQIFYHIAMLTDPALVPLPEVVTLVGMAGLAAAVVGGPLTMSFLALEISGSLPLTIAVLAAAVASSLLVRQTFGYSFTTWRFHLRGEAIRGAQDIGWIRNLTVGRMMRKDIRTVPAEMSVREFRRSYPLIRAAPLRGRSRQGAHAACR